MVSASVAVLNGTAAPADRRSMKTGGILLGILALLPGAAVGVTFAAGVNLYYHFHPVYFLGTAVALALTWSLSTASLRAFGVRRGLAVSVPPVVAVAWTAVLFLSLWHGYPDMAAAARRHDVALRKVPVYPGAQILGKETSGRGAVTTTWRRDSSISRRTSRRRGRGVCRGALRRARSPTGTRCVCGRRAGA